MNRRSFLEKIATAVPGTILAVTAPAVSMLGLASAAKQSFSSAKEDPSPVTTQFNGTGKTAIQDFRRTVNGVQYRLNGVNHNRQSAQDHYTELEDKVRRAAVVVSEGNLANSNAYFNTIHSLCLLHNKPLVYLDNLSSSAMIAEVALATGTAVISSKSGIALYGNHNRREILRAAVIGSAATVLCLGTVYGGMGTQLLYSKSDSNDPAAALEQFSARTPFSHVTSHRNVEWTRRLLTLPSMLPQHMLANGEYILVDGGAGHISSIRTLLERPERVLRQHYAYAWNYGLLDSNTIELHEPVNGAWTTRTLKG